jgi:DedD protein
MRRARRLHCAVSPPCWVVKVKERLTGAIILVVLIVLLVPELLTGPIRSAPRAAAVAASAEGAPLRAYTINLADEARAHGATTQASGPQQPSPLPASATSATSPAAATDSAPASAMAAPASPPKAAAASADASTAPPHAAAGSADGFMVQLGSFASRANAERLARQVRAQGFQASVSQGTGGRHWYRVRVGPAPDQSSAGALAQQLRSAGHSGSIVPR